MKHLSRLRPARLRSPGAVAWLAGIACLVATPAAAAALNAGAARVEITPPAGDFPYTVPREKTFVGVHDPIFARALALEQGKRRIILVVMDQTTVHDAAATTRAIAAAAGVPASAVLLFATHTHNVPLAFFHNGEVTNPAQPREIAQAQAGAAAAAKAAVAALRPARIGWARGQAFVNTNNGEEANRKGWYDPAASSDKSLDVVRVVGTDGKPIALLLNYASHGEVMFRSVTKDGGYEVSGDLPGATSRLLEATPDGAPVVLFTPAAEGDQLPLFKSLQPAAELPATDHGAGGWTLLEAQARRLAGAALDTVAAMPAGADPVSLGMASGAAVCPGQHYDVERPSGRVLGVRDTGPVSIPVTVLRVGDFALAGVGADLASDIGAGIKRGSSATRLTVATMMGDAIGYVLNDAAFVHPGHGALGSPVKPGCAPQALARTTMDLLEKAK